MKNLNEDEYYVIKKNNEVSGYKGFQRIINVLFGSGLIILGIIMLIVFAFSTERIWWGAWVVFILVIRAGWYVLTEKDW